MMTGASGGELFIVDNSVSGWTGLQYLRQWCAIARSFDIATGYFEIGGLLDLDGEWQKLDKIRILLGADMTLRTRKMLLDALRARTSSTLDSSLEADKEANPFLTGVTAVAAALRSGKIECRVYDKDKFHAKAYITHARIAVVGAQALVGSSNFTRPGLTQNIELNIQVQSGRDVAQLQEWFDLHWQQGKDITDEVLAVLTRQTREYTPFDVYSKALREFFSGHELTEKEWEEGRSRMFPVLDRYQKEAYWAMVKIARQYGGAFLCDGVGLGKTFVGLMLIERLVLHEGKRVLLLAPKAAKEGVWVPHLRQWLPHIGGVGGGDFSNLAVLSHTDLNREGDFPARFARIAELADAVVIDEAHHFRNPGVRGDPDFDQSPSRYYKLFDLLDGTVRPKHVYMLTATPINNQLSDLRHMIELFTRRQEDVFARSPMGIHNLTSHFNQMEKQLRKQLQADQGDLTERVAELQGVLTADSVFRHLVVQRSRAYARESQLKEGGSTTVFPTREPPAVAAYSIKKSHGKLLSMVAKAFSAATPLFRLAIYAPIDYLVEPATDKSTSPDELRDRAFNIGRQRQVVSLIRTQFLKRFESSVNAFELSCDRLLLKLQAWVEKHSESKSEKALYQRWKDQHAETLAYVHERTTARLYDEGDEDDGSLPDSLLEAVDKLDRAVYKVGEILSETLLDLAEVCAFIEEARKFQPEHDDKLQTLITLLQGKDLACEKVLVFTEFADTARYVEKQLKLTGIAGVHEVDGGSTTNRAEVIRAFAPYYNGLSSGELTRQGRKEIRILISTDVLSEGLNLQDACRMINYDIHWNPVRLMQRVGRVDRRMNPQVEKQLLADHPALAPDRGKVWFWNFLPPDELNVLLTLYAKVTHKTLRISKTLGIEGKKLLTPEDDFDALREFNHAYEGQKSVVEELHLQYQELLKTIPNLEQHLDGLPGAVFSGRKRPDAGTRGVFFCYALPALDRSRLDAAGEPTFTEQAGTVRWYLYDIAKDQVLVEPADIVDSIRCRPDTGRSCQLGEVLLKDIRAKVQRHIKDSYLKKVDAPVGVKPVLRCWMEIHD